MAWSFTTDYQDSCKLLKDCCVVLCLNVKEKKDFSDEFYISNEVQLSDISNSWENFCFPIPEPRSSEEVIRVAKFSLTVLENMEINRAIGEQNDIDYTVWDDIKHKARKDALQCYFSVGRRFEIHCLTKLARIFSVSLFKASPVCIDDITAVTNTLKKVALPYTLLLEKTAFLHNVLDILAYKDAASLDIE